MDLWTQCKSGSNLWQRLGPDQQQEEKHRELNHSRSGFTKRNHDDLYHAQTVNQQMSCGKCDNCSTHHWLSVILCESEILAGLHFLTSVSSCVLLLSLFLQAFRCRAAPGQTDASGSQTVLSWCPGSPAATGSGGSPLSRGFSTREDLSDGWGVNPGRVSVSGGDGHEHGVVRGPGHGDAAGQRLLGTSGWMWGQSSCGEETWEWLTFRWKGATGRNCCKML